MKRCEKCGKFAGDDQIFCTECGVRLVEINEEGRNKKNVITISIGKLAALIVGVMLGVTALVAAGFFIYSRLQNTGTSSESSALTKSDASSNDAVSTDDADSAEETKSLDEIEAECTAAANEVNNLIASGACTQLTLDNGAEVYYEGTELRKIYVRENTDSIPYERTFYYTDSNLVYAVYSSADSYRFCYDRGALARITYLKDKSNSSDYHNFDNADDWKEWPTYVSDQNVELKALARQAERENFQAADSYIFPDSHECYLTVTDLMDLTDAELEMAYYEIYAREGKIFDDPDLYVYFQQKNWYNPTVSESDFDAQEDTLLNNYEQYNRDLLSGYLN